MFDNLSGKQGVIFGLISGMGLSAIIGFIILTPTLLKTSADAKNLATNHQTQPAVQQQTPAATQTQQPNNLPKSDKPGVELFVMSHCPYGLQMEKALIPAYELLKNKADITIRFVSYAMHGKSEVEENTRQYCAQQQNKDRYYTYLNCYADSGDSAGCMKTSGLNENKINSCVNTTNKQFAIIDKYNDQTTWLNGKYPQYPINEVLNTKYGVQGSPTLVINGVQVEADRTPDGLKSVICSAFNNPPAECGQTLTGVSPQAGLGGGQTPAAPATGGCGG